MRRKQAQRRQEQRTWDGQQGSQGQQWQQRGIQEQQRPRKKAIKPELEEVLRQAKQTTVYLHAAQLQKCCSGRLSLQLCLHLLTQQPTLLGMPPSRLAARLRALGGALGLTAEEAAQLVAAETGVLDVLPYRMRRGAEALAAALEVDYRTALDAIASGAGGMGLLDRPPLRVRQQAAALAGALQLPLASGVAAALRELTLLGTTQEDLQSRLECLASLLGVPQPHAAELAVREPRLLRPPAPRVMENWEEMVRKMAKLVGRDAPSPALAAGGGGGGNGGGAPDGDSEASGVTAGADERVGTGAGGRRSGGGGDASRKESGGGGPCASAEAAAVAAARCLLQGWLRRAPLLLVLQAHVVELRLSKLRLSLSHLARTQPARGPFSVADTLAYVGRDPRLLLLPHSQLQERLQCLRLSLPQPLEVLLWLVMHHPSYLLLEPGVLEVWLRDVRELLQLSRKQAGRIAACPQVFLTMSPKDMLRAALDLCQLLRLPYSSVVPMFCAEPLLLVQAPQQRAAALARLRAVFDGARNASGAAAATTMQLLQQRPQLLLLAPGQLERQLLVVAELLLPPPPTAAAPPIAAGAPSTALGLPAEAPVPQQPAGLASTPSCTAAHQPPVQGLGLDHDLAAQGLGLSRDPNLVHTRSAGAAAAALAPDLLRCPELLELADCASAPAALRALLDSGLRPPSQLLAVARASPALLAQPPSALAASAAALAAAAAAHPSWQLQLRDTLPPAGVAACLKFSVSSRFKRLEFFAGTGLAPRIPLLDALSQQTPEFYANFGEEFAAWRWRVRNRAALAAEQPHPPSSAPTPPASTAGATDRGEPAGVYFAEGDAQLGAWFDRQEGAEQLPPCTRSPGDELEPAPMVGGRLRAAAPRQPAAAAGGYKGNAVAAVVEGRAGTGGAGVQVEAADGMGSSAGAWDAGADTLAGGGTVQEGWDDGDASVDGGGGAADVTQREVLMRRIAEAVQEMY